MSDSLLLPEGFGTLGINVQRPSWRTEVNIHTTPTYLSYLENLRMNSEGLGCYFCGFPDGPYLEVHHLDGDHDNWEDENLRAACSMCHRLHHLGWVGIKSQGVLIHLPSDAEATDNSPDGSPKWSLEVFNIIQRFYLMTPYLSPVQRKKIEALPLKKSINLLLGSFKRRNYEESYNSIRTKVAEKAEEHKKLQGMTKDQKDEYFKKQLEKKEADRLAESKVGEEDVSFLSGDMHVVDLVDALCEEHILFEEGESRKPNQKNPADMFFETQKNATYGRLTIWFNEGVFAPFEPMPDYTLKERMNYYNDIGLFSAKGISHILHDARVRSRDSQPEKSNEDVVVAKDVTN